MSLSRLAPAALLLASTLSAAVAAADDKAVCLAASEAGQTARDAKKLGEAARSFLTCSSATCPKVVAESCEQWAREVADLQPTVVFRAVDGRGKELTDAVVRLDGVDLPASTIGKPVPVDPGSHRVVFLHALGTVDQSVVVVEGQKGRVVTAQLESKAAPVASAVPPPMTTAAPVPPPPPPAASPSVAPYVIGGIGVASLLVSGAFFLSYNGKKSSLAESCRSDGACPPSQQDTIDGANFAGNVSLITAIVGVAGVGVGTWLLVSGKPSATSAAVGVGPGGSPFASMSHRF